MTPPSVRPKPTIPNARARQTVTGAPPPSRPRTLPFRPPLHRHNLHRFSPPSQPHPLPSRRRPPLRNPHRRQNLSRRRPRPWPLYQHRHQPRRLHHRRIPSLRRSRLTRSRRLPPPRNLFRRQLHHRHLHRRPSRPRRCQPRLRQLWTVHISRSAPRLLLESWLRLSRCSTPRARLQRGSTSRI